MDRRAENEGIIMFYHFVSGEGFSNAEVAVVYRRFLQKVPLSSAWCVCHVILTFS